MSKSCKNITRPRNILTHRSTQTITLSTVAFVFVCIRFQWCCTPTVGQQHIIAAYHTHKIEHRGHGHQLKLACEPHIYSIIHMLQYFPHGFDTNVLTFQQTKTHKQTRIHTNAHDSYAHDNTHTNVLSSRERTHARFSCVFVLSSVCA